MHLYLGLSVEWSSSGSFHPSSFEREHAASHDHIPCKGFDHEDAIEEASKRRRRLSSFREEAKGSEEAQERDNERDKAS